MPEEQKCSFSKHFLKSGRQKPGEEERKGQERVWGMKEKQKTTDLCSHFRGTLPPHPVNPAHGCSASHEGKSPACDSVGE